MHIDFYKQILKSKDEYWIVAKRTSYREYMETKIGKDDILFIAIPKLVPRGIAYSDILLANIEELEKTEIRENVYLSADYPPFQTNQTFYEIYQGFPVSEKTREFFNEAVKFQSNELYEYKKLYENICKKETSL